jgi:hypothetical protein
VTFFRVKGQSLNLTCIVKDQIQRLHPLFKTNSTRTCAGNTNTPKETRHIVYWLHYIRSTIVTHSLTSSSELSCKIIGALPEASAPATPSDTSPPSLGGCDLQGSHDQVLQGRKYIFESSHHLKGMRTPQHLIISSTICHNCFKLFQAISWKQRAFLSFYKPQHCAEETMLIMPNFLLHNQHLAMDS